MKVGSHAVCPVNGPSRRGAEAHPPSVEGVKLPSGMAAAARESTRDQRERPRKIPAEKQGKVGRIIGNAPGKSSVVDA